MGRAPGSKAAGKLDRGQKLVTTSLPAQHGGKGWETSPKVVLPSATTPSWGGPSTPGPHSVS